MATKASEARSLDARTRADATFRKEERAKDGAKAMMEYQANSRVVREQMAKLKALRLAKEAADKAETPVVKPSVKRAPAVKRSRASR